jgi:hypothetical protein
MRSLTFALLLFASLLSQSCRYLLFPPETFRDMQLQADALGLPEDFVLVSAESGGLRSTFAASSPPEVEREYSAPWEAGKLCARVRSLTGWASVWPTWEDSSHREQGGCGYDTRIAAGWRAWPVNVWSYKVFASVAPPASRLPSEDECIEIRAREVDQVKSGHAGVYQRDWSTAWCWVPADHALVSITIRAGQGWFMPAV